MTDNLTRALAESMDHDADLWYDAQTHIIVGQPDCEIGGERYYLNGNLLVTVFVDDPSRPRPRYDFSTPEAIHASIRAIEADLAARDPAQRYSDAWVVATPAEAIAVLRAAGYDVTLESAWHPLPTLSVAAPGGERR